MLLERGIRDDPKLQGDHVTFTGHSLGGGLAGLMA
ncbi:lipase family protein [Phyllobacterium sp. CCNWLW109]